MVTLCTTCLEFKTRQATYVRRKYEARSRNHCCSGKATSITYSKCVCVCSISFQHEMRMRHIVICGLHYSTVFFHIISLTVRFFEKKSYWTQIVFWVPLQLLSAAFLILRRVEPDMIKIHIGLHVKYPLFLSDFNETWTFFGRISKNTQLPNFMKIRLQGAEMFHVDRRTDGYDEANSRFSQFCERV